MSMRDVVWVVSVGSLLGFVAVGTAQAQDAGGDPFVPAPAEPAPEPPSNEYAPPQQVYTVDVYEQPAQPTGPYVPQQQPQMAPTHPGRRQIVPYDEGMPVPPNGYVRTRRRTGLIISGGVIFGVTYLITGLAGSLALRIRDGSDTADPQIWVPIVGPMLVSESGGVRTAAVMSGLMQTTGLILFISGFAAKRRELVYYTENGRGLNFGVVPTRGGAMASLTVF